MKLLTLLLTGLLYLSPVTARADSAESPGYAGPVTEDRVAPEEPTLGEQKAGPADPEQNGCEFSDLVGQKADAIDKTRFGDRTVRTLSPGQAVTMEYMMGRVNLQVDDAGVIIAVTCG